MRIAINDHSGHSFILQLSRQLARFGHEVLHSYSTSFQSPKGDFTKKDTDPLNFNVLPIANKKPFAKYSLLKRRKQEIEYADILIEKLRKFKPEALIAGTAPLFVQERLQKYCLANNISFYYWCQDIYSEAIKKIAKKKIGLLGLPIWTYFKHLEVRLLKRSTHVIVITDDFNNTLQAWGVGKNRVTCIPNWAPIEEIELVPKINSWSRRYNADEKICITYSGTLGLKHNPLMLSAAARYFTNRQDVTFIVISEGLGADILKKEKEAFDLHNLELLPFQNFRDMGAVLGASDILLAILESDAGEFSVPSKVLTYLCAEKPIVLAVPQNNLSAKIVLSAKAGLCGVPSDVDGFCNNISKLIEDPALRAKMGANGRRYALENFDIKTIAEKFIDILGRNKF